MQSLNINRDNGIPLYLQLRDQIASFIESGLWHPGFKLPTERELAQVLDVSRNTISLAYKDLADRGLVESQQGRGTFVKKVPGSSQKKTDAPGQTPSQEHLELMTDNFLQRVLNVGFDLATVETTLQRRIQVRRSILSQVSVGFIECNREQLDYFSKSLQLGAGVQVVPILLSELTEKCCSQRTLTRLQLMDLVVTTFFHLEQVRGLLGDEVEVVGIALDPEMETMVRIAQLPKNEEIGLLCSSQNFAERVLKSLAQSGLDYLQIQVETSPEPSAVQKLVESVETVVVSPGRRQEVEQYTAQQQEIIEFIYKPDAGSVNTLQHLVLSKSDSREE